MDNQVGTKIKQRETIYDIVLEYHSDMMCQNYDAKLEAIEESNGNVSFRPYDGKARRDSFTFLHSDPDRIIAIARMMLAFAEMVKNDHKKSIDISKND
jgi:hypothetical protein